jgi:hypothetical protein
MECDICSEVAQQEAQDDADNASRAGDFGEVAASPSLGRRGK